LGIPNPAGNRWRDKEITLLGALPDREVARRLGRSVQPVTQKPIKLGIANPLDGRRGGSRSWVIHPHHALIGSPGTDKARLAKHPPKVAPSRRALSG
jgi:hypothetical protein